MEPLLDVLGQVVHFAYTCWDRIVLSGYIERLQRPENLIYFFRSVVGIDALEPAVLEQRTTAYKAWVRRVTQERDIPLVAAPRGVKKEELVVPYFNRGVFSGYPHAGCLLTPHALVDNAKLIHVLLELTARKPDRTRHMPPR